MKEISAEFLLNYMYPEMADKWSVLHKGEFYRNYNDDIMRMDVESGHLELSRNSILMALPDSYISPESEMDNEADKKEAYKRIHKRLDILKEAFSPIDTFHFHSRMKIEKEVSELLTTKLPFILKEYFDFDIEKEINEYILKTAPLLPYASQLRGKMPFLKSLIETVTGHRVVMKQSAFSDTDNSKYWMPKVHFSIIMDDLSKDDYMNEIKMVEQFAAFLTERFIPFDMVCQIDIKGRQYRNILLNYNSETNK